jgi:hypothetical protein
MDGWKCKLAPRLGGGGGCDDKGQWGIYPGSYRGERRRWMALSVISSGMEFVRGLVLEKRGDVM